MAKSALTRVPRRVRYDGPWSMDLLNNPRGWGVSLLKNALVWEVPRMCVGAFVRWKYGKGKDATEKEKEFVDCASSYVISAVHAVVISGLGLKILSLLWDVPAHDKFYVNDTMTDFSTIDLIERANWLFFGYMMDDLVHVLVQYPKLGKMDMVAHHLVFIICAILAGGTQIFVFPFAWLLIGELSTPLLTAKWFMRQMASANSPTLQKIAASLGQPHATCTEAAAAMELLVAKVFILVFFLVRVCVYGGGLTHTARHLLAGTFWEIPTAPSVVVLTILCLGAALNAHWFKMMMSKALGLGKYADKKKA